MTTGRARRRDRPGHRTRNAVGMLAVAMVVSACGMFEGVVTDEEAGPRAATVAVLAPAGTVDGRGVHAAVDLAISEKTSDIDGWTLNVELIDADVAADELADLARDIVDDDVVAVVGGLSAETVRAVQPVFDSASVLVVSPADTVPEHTRGADPASPLRPYSTYYRTSVTGETPMQALARHAVGALNTSTVAVLDAGASDEADEFAAAVADAGGEVTHVGGDAGSDERVDDVPGLVKSVRTAGADAVFVAGRSAVAAAVADEVTRLGLDVELLGGSVLRSEDFLAEAGSSAEGALTAVAGELEKSTGSSPVDLDARLADAGVRSAGRYAAAAYDAGLAVGTVLTRCLPPASSARGARQGCAGEMSEVAVTGVTGDVSFDAFGDRVGARPVMMVVQGGTWTATDASE